MRTGPAGVALIKEFEGFPYGGRPYRDMVGVWTIGYGHTEGVSASSSRLTERQASELLRKDLDQKYAPSVSSIRVSLRQNQFDALVSFVYNCGPGAVSDKTKVGRALRAKQFNQAADGLLEWNKAGGRPVEGLTRRRKRERALFLENDDPLDGYTDSEKAWIREYDKLRRAGKNVARRRELRAEMAGQRKRIWRAAQPADKGGDGNGWDHGHRRERYASLRVRTQ